MVMKQIITLSLAFISIFSNSFAVDRIYNIGYTTAIVADDVEWSCSVTQAPNDLVFSNQNGIKYIAGKSKHFPLTFLFYDGGHGHHNFENNFKDYAIKTNTIITKLKDTSKPPNWFTEWEFYTGASSGYIQTASMLFENHKFIVVCKIDSTLLDEHSRETLYNSVHDLITPLYNPKALNLWLESVEKTQNGDDLNE